MVVFTLLRGRRQEALLHRARSTAPPSPPTLLLRRPLALISVWRPKVLECRTPGSLSSAIHLCFNTADQPRSSPQGPSQQWGPFKTKYTTVYQVPQSRCHDIDHYQCRQRGNFKTESKRILPLALKCCISLY